MSILVTGSTGKIGSQVVSKLVAKGAQVRALTRSPEKATFPAGVEAVKGDLLDTTGVRTALQGVSTLFLLVPNSPDEITQAMNTVGLAHDAGVRGIVYLSVTRSDVFADVPHFASKHAVERMMKKVGLEATVLRPSYFFQNDIGQKEPMLGGGVYVSPIGEKGVSMVDIDDIAEAAARELLRREKSATPLPTEVYELVGPDALTGDAVARIWTEALGREVKYGGNDLDAFENKIAQFAPGWMAYDMRLMMHRYQKDGAAASKGDVERLTALLGRAPRSYRDFAQATAKDWTA
ncbi:MAG TPA: NmrA/HSCARG family protein [Pinirhizobacter sp.]|uniref:SDR family oxidoreductase n=1 Tax=Pinirhizobacter sp. TaxID=2950432 RepID=UPI002CACA72F|nr:NmrA/HSCARG family protein [Pinirhizobacter sp.]HMH68541.1 NmrA/HSCARG family protein [Pinirhizobacter sp.]